MTNTMSIKLLIDTADKHPLATQKCRLTRIHEGNYEDFSLDTISTLLDIDYYGDQVITSIKCIFPQTSHLQ